MSNISRDQRRIKKARILQHATQLFVEKGFQNTTTRTIAQAAKVSESSIFTYFGSKDALLVAMVVPAAPATQTEVAVTTPWETIANLIRNHFYNVPRVEKQLLRDFMAIMRRTSNAAENEVRASAESYDKRLWDAIRQAVLCFDLHEPEAAFSIISAIYYHCFTTYSIDESMTLEEMMLRIESLMRYSLEPHWDRTERQGIEADRVLII